ncbi:NUDIX hydrolase domain-like protein [Hysterangium stoloniferum]|nr:NUDIX hydrolase domain-like protein [Hysterangium stoloniferum]
MAIFPHRSPLLNFHKPQKLGLKYPLKAESLACLRNLSKYQRPKPPGRFPRSRRAAVLVALFIGREGDLYVLLSQRAEKLRSYPGDTSLPGGKLERNDRSIENTARREAFEEIGLPLDKNKVPLLCILEPFLAGNNVIVTPVVVLVLDPTLRPILNRSEVQSLFSHPLLGFLTTSPIPVERAVSNTYALEPPAKPYHTFRDIGWHGRHVRMHSFLTGREDGGVKPVYGLTSSILVRTAQIGYAKDPDFQLNAEGQLSIRDRITIAMRVEESLRHACEAEGIEKDWLKYDISTGSSVNSKEHIRGRL